MAISYIGNEPLDWTPPPPVQYLREAFSVISSSYSLKTDFVIGEGNTRLNSSGISITGSLSVNSGSVKLISGSKIIISYPTVFEYNKNSKYYLYNLTSPSEEYFLDGQNTKLSSLISNPLHGSVLAIANVNLNTIYSPDSLTYTGSSIGGMFIKKFIKNQNDSGWVSSSQDYLAVKNIGNSNITFDINWDTDSIFRVITSASLGENEQYYVSNGMIQLNLIENYYTYSTSDIVADMYAFDFESYTNTSSLLITCSFGYKINNGLTSSILKDLGVNNTIYAGQLDWGGYYTTFETEEVGDYTDPITGSIFNLYTNVSGIYNFYATRSSAF